MNLIEEICTFIPTEMTLGLALSDSLTGKRLLLNEDEWFPLASLAKFITTALAFINDTNVSLQAAHSAIAEHDSGAYRDILNVFSNDQANQALQESELKIKLHPDNKMKQENCGTPLSVLKFMEGLSKFELPVVMYALRNQQDSDGFRFHRFSQGDWSHMTGGLEGVCNDIGYWKLPDRTITCVGLLKSSDGVEWSLLEGKMREVGEAIHRAYGNLEQTR